MKNLIINIIVFSFIIMSCFLISTSKAVAQTTGTGRKLDIPYISQENRPDCWAATIIMIAEAVAARTDNDLMRVVFETGNTDGIRLDNLESNTTLLNFIENRAGNASLIVRTFSDNETSNLIGSNAFKNDFNLLSLEVKDVLNHITQQIDAGRPVMFCSSSKMASSEPTGPASGHCITIVGYKDRTNFYIHDPKGRSNTDINNLVNMSYFLKNLQENTIYTTISISAPIASNRHMLQTYIDEDAFIFDKLSTATSKGDKILYHKSFSNGNLFEWIEGSGKVYQTIPELFDNIATTGSSIKIYNASNINQKVVALYEIGRRDNSSVLSTVSNSIDIGPNAISTFDKSETININISSLRDKVKPVDCYLKLTLVDGNNRIFYEEDFDFTLDPSYQELTLIPQYINCNKFNLKIESIKPLPTKIRYDYEIEHKNSTYTDKFSTDQNPAEYSFVKGGKYNVKVKLVNATTTSGKDKIVEYGEAETEVDVINPPVIIRSRTTPDDLEYEFEADSCLSKPDRTWYISEGSSPKTKLTDNSVIIRHKFPKEGFYRVYVELRDSTKTKLLAEDSILVTVKQSATAEIEEAFKNKNWKKLVELHRNAKTDIEKKLIFDYLKQLATEMNDANKKILESLKNHNAKNSSNYQSYYNKASAELRSLSGSKDDAKRNELYECMDNTKDKYEREDQQIESAIQYFENLNNEYNNMNIDNAGELFFQMNEKKQLSVPYDLDKPFPEVDYNSFCSNTKAVNEVKKVKVTLRASNNNPKAGDIVEIEAIVQRPKHSIGCSEEDYFEWTGENIGLSNNIMGMPDSSASFVASKAGSYPIGVTVSCSGQKLDSDSITITVKGGLTGVIRDLDSEVYFGSSKDIRLDTSLDALSQASGNNITNAACMKQQQEYEEQKKEYEECQASNANLPDESKVVCRAPLPPEFDECAGKTEGSYSVLWQASEENIKFLPKEGTNGNTNITFTRMSDNLQVWAEVRQFKGGVLETLGRVENSQVKVLPPEFTIEFYPPSNKAKIGETITAQIQSDPPVDPSIIDYRWIEPTDRKEITNGKIEFVPKDNKPIKFHIIARVPHYGETINDSIKDEYTPGEYEVIAKLVGPKFDKNFPNWSEKDKGLAYKPKKLVTGMQIVASATTKDIEPEKVNYEWKSNDGCHIDAGQYSNEVTVSRNEPGSCDLIVIAHDKEKRRLGEGNLSFNIMEQDTGGSTTSTSDKDKDKDKVNKAKTEANEKFEKAKEEITKGNLDEAIIILDEASKLDPDNSQIKDTLNKTKEEKNLISVHIDKANQLISEGKFNEAEKELDEAKKINSNYKTIAETATKIKTAKSQYAEKLFNEANQLVGNGKLNEAIIKLDEAVKNDPNNKNITDYKDKITSEKALIDQTAKSFNLNISSGNYDEAEKELESITSLHPNYQPVVVAKAIWNSRLPERMGQVTGALQSARDLVTQGKLDEAIQILEEALIKAKKIKEAFHLATQVSDYLNQLKTEKNTVLDQITKAKQLISNKNFNEADRELAVARQLHGNYQPVKDATAFFDSEKKKYEQNSELVNGKIQKAKWLVEEGKLDEAITWADDAVSLDPNNTYATNYADQLKTEKKTCLDQVDKVKTLVAQNNIESARQELIIATNLHPMYLPVVQAAELINSKDEITSNIVKEKINEASISLTNQEYKKVMSLVNELKTNYKLNQQDLVTLTNIESAAKKAISDKDQAIICLKSGENQYNQHEYQGAISNFEAGLGRYSYVWEPTDTEPEYFSKLLSLAKKKQARIDLLMTTITGVVQNNTADLDTLKKALVDTQEVIFLQPENNQAQSYINILNERINKLASKQNTTQMSTYGNFQQNQNYSSGSQTRSFNLTNNTNLTINVPNSWNVELENDGTINFYNQNAPVMVSIINFASNYSNNCEKDSFINNHKNILKNNSTTLSFQDKNAYINGLDTSVIGFTEKSGSDLLYNDFYYPYNKRKLFEVLVSTRNNPSIASQEKSALLQNISNAILKEDSSYNNISSNQNQSSTQNQNSSTFTNKNLVQDYLNSHNKAGNTNNTYNNNKNNMIGSINDTLSTIKTNKQNHNTAKTANLPPVNNNHQSNQSFDTSMSGSNSSGSFNDHINTISSATNNKSNKGNTSTSTGSTSISPTDTKIIAITNPGGCSFTDRSTFKLNSPHFVSKLEIWYSWDQGEQSVPYNLSDYNNNLIKSGVFTRGSCDPYQRQWCQGLTEVQINLNPSNYTLKLARPKLCQNSASGGNGFISVYSNSSRSNNTNIGTNKTSTTQNTVKTSTPKTGNTNSGGSQSITFVIFNENSNSIHFFTDGETFGPQNKVAPGSSRTFQLTMSPGKTCTFYAGRNGQKLATTPILYANVKDSSRVHLKFNDSQELYIHEKFKRF